MNNHVHVFVRIWLSFLLSKYEGADWLDHMAGIWYINLSRKYRAVLESGCSTFESPGSCTSLPALAMFCRFNFSNSGKEGVVFHCDFNWGIPDYSCCWVSFQGLFAIHVAFWWSWCWPSAGGVSVLSTWTCPCSLSMLATLGFVIVFWLGSIRECPKWREKARQKLYPFSWPAPEVT